MKKIERAIRDGLVDCVNREGGNGHHRMGGAPQVQFGEERGDGQVL